MVSRQDPVRFRDLTDVDIPAALQLCRASHWNQVRRDWEHFLRLSPQGCRGADLDGIVGTVTTVRYAPEFAWIGMLLVEPAQRGKGIGLALLNEALCLLSDVPSVWLDATPAGYEIYRKHGFEEDSRLVRMECFAPGAPKSDATRVIPLLDASQIAEIDQEVFGADRQFHLNWLTSGDGARAFAMNDGTGYLLSRPGENFFHIGPLVASSLDAAQALLGACLHSIEEQPVIVDTPLHQALWIKRLKLLGFHEQRGFIRMRKGAAGAKRQHVSEYAVMGPEFG